ncbi:MAG: hypothetical protein U0414_19745 [Polyangiaceae bacterium]
MSDPPPPPPSVAGPPSLPAEKPSLWLRIACVLVLISLALIAWAILHPVPLAVIAAMSIGQGVGTIGAAMFLWVVVRDLRRALGARRSSPKPPSTDAP